ncbi:hypothetical protein BT96DRAFT_958338 [Gymnopus androsaceus JB14]|uniref:Transcription elongation factor 1 homolog n=1 Tax=Gymnopus androsaceus JB14 TaxID=1447944 RepID=A0A6A4HCP4_9AGAR|nr:hypothetical protein BT96DRAFT_958338 [Gymnopus androsaceus JB14]
MGKRKKSSRKPGPAKMKVPLDTTFTCLFCHHEKSVTVRIDRKEGFAQLVLSNLTEPIDIYSEWIDAADEAENAAVAECRVLYRVLSQRAPRAGDR